MVTAMKMLTNLFCSRNFRPKTVIVFLCVATTLWPPTANAASVRLCGEKLVKMVLSICDNCVHGVYMDTSRTSSAAKSESQCAKGDCFVFILALAGSVNFELDADQIPPQNEAEIPFQAPSMSGLVAYVSENAWSTNSRRKRGIVDDCCISQCSYNTLKSYCCRTSG